MLIRIISQTPTKYSTKRLITQTGPGSRPLLECDYRIQSTALSFQKKKTLFC